MPTHKINSIGLFIDGRYFQLISEGLKKEKKNAVNLHNLINYIQLAIAYRFNLAKTSCIVTESHYFQGRFKADRINQETSYSDRFFEDKLVAEDVIFHYKHMQWVKDFVAGKKLKEKGIDVWFALESYELAQYRDFDFVVLLTGDADHEMLARKIKALKKQVVLLTWNFDKNDSTSPALREECTFHIDLARLVAENPNFVSVLTGDDRREFSEMAKDTSIPYIQ